MVCACILGAFLEWEWTFVWLAVANLEAHHIWASDHGKLCLLHNLLLEFMGRFVLPIWWTQRFSWRVVEHDRRVSVWSTTAAWNSTSIISLLHMQKLLKHPLLQSSVTSYGFQSSQVHHQCLLKAQMILLKADLAAWLAKCNEYSN